MSTELAWAAGFFDGEGTAFAYDSKWKGKEETYLYPTMRLAVCQSGEFALELLERFQKALGGLGYINGPIQPKAKVTHQLRWDWRCQGYDMGKEVIELLMPYLGPYKRKQIAAALKTVEEYKANKPHRLRGQPSHR